MLHEFLKATAQLPPYTEQYLRSTVMPPRPPITWSSLYAAHTLYVQLWGITNLNFACVPLQVQDAFARKKHQLERAVKSAVVRMRNKMQALEQQQAATEKAEATRKQADLLTANLWKCKQGDKEVEV